MDSPVVEGLVEGSEPIEVLIQPVVVDEVGWHRRVVLVTDIVIPGQVVEGRLGSLEDPERSLRSRAI